MTAAVGSLGKLGLASSGTATQRIDYMSENLVCDEEFLDTNGIRGTLTRAGERVRQGVRRIGGQLMLEPNSLEWTYLLQWITGGTPSGSPTVTYPLGNGLVTKDVTVDRVQKVFQYTSCAVDTFRLRGAEAQPLQVELGLVGVDETVANAGTFPALNIDVTTGPFVFMDLALVVNSTTVQAREVEITVENHIDRSRFFNSQTLTALNKLDRRVTLSTSLPYGDFSALYATGASGVAATATFTNGGAVLTVSIPRVALPRKSPHTPGRVEVMLPLVGNCFGTGGGSELTITLNPGP
jgi:hypothetical protein